MDCPCFGLLVASILKSGPEIKNRCTEVAGMMLAVAVIVNSGPEIRNRCTDIPEMCFIAAAIANSGTEIGNHSSAIVSASRMARLRKVIAATLPRLMLFFFAAK